MTNCILMHVVLTDAPIEKNEMTIFLLYLFYVVYTYDFVAYGYSNKFYFTSHYIIIYINLLRHIDSTYGYYKTRNERK